MDSSRTSVIDLPIESVDFLQCNCLQYTMHWIFFFFFFNLHILVTNKHSYEVHKMLHYLLMIGGLCRYF